MSLTKNQTLSPVGFCTAPEGVHADAVPVTMARDFPLSLAVVVRDSLIPSREPKQGVFQSAVTTFKGTVEIITQGQGWGGSEASC